MDQRREWGRVAASVHRLSGLILATFLPLHFLSLGLALDEPAFASFILWTDNMAVKLSETVLVAALAVHLAGGVRLLGVEFLGLTRRTGLALSGVVCFGLAAGLLFLLNVFG